MPKGEVQKLPVRSFKNSLETLASSQFDIVDLKPMDENIGINVEPHRHDYYHILFVKNGIGKHTIDFKTYDIIPNSIFFVSPGQVHSIVINKDVEGYVISFNSEFYLLRNDIQKRIDYPFFHSFNNKPVIYLPNKNEVLHSTLADIYEESKTTNKGREQILRALLEVFIIRASRFYIDSPLNEAPSHLSYQIRKLETLIDEHFRAFKLLDDYANMMFISPKHLNNICKKGLDKTVTKLIHERLLIEAKRLLLFTDNTITEISFELGFTDKSYFMRFFKKHMSLTADRFRQQNKT